MKKRVNGVMIGLFLSLWLCTAAQVAADALPKMPEGVTSFAAATLGRDLYLCGGHKGERHEYSAEMVSGAFHRLNLESGKEWEKLPGTIPAQGAPLVAYDVYLYRSGGMAARNRTGEKQDLWSLTNVVRFSTKTGAWEDFAALPEPRSSHDALVVGNRLYVVGGWNMRGGETKPDWFDHLLVIDLKRPENGWQRVGQPFKRRALAVAEQNGKLYCIGGMDSDSKATLAVSVFDLSEEKWSDGPALPEGKFKGFSCSAIAEGGRIYASAFQGDLLRLSNDGSQWEKVSRLEHLRMAHRLVRGLEKQVVALGGEDGDGKVLDLEVFKVDAATKKEIVRN